MLALLVKSKKNKQSAQPKEGDAYNRPRPRRELPVQDSMAVACRHVGHNASEASIHVRCYIEVEVSCRLTFAFGRNWYRTPRNGRAVRQRRQKLGVSQEESAGLCGLDRTYIGGIERGERNLSLVNIETIAQTFGTFS